MNTNRAPCGLQDHNIASHCGAPEAGGPSLASITIPNIWVYKSFVYDLNPEPGIVSIASGLVPRAAEIKPATRRFVPNIY
jgi:hypothetical protein